MIDSHAHVGDAAFDADRGAVLERAAQAGLSAILCVGQDEDTSRRAVRTAEQGGGALELRASAGLHPHEAKHWTAQRAALEEIARSPFVAAVGETGLDFHYNYSEPREQRAAFQEHLHWARRVRKPIVVHVREAHEEALEDLRAAQLDVTPVIHCFTGTPEHAKRYLDLGAYVSFSGIVTFKNAADVRASAAFVPLDRMMIETDSPLLAPIPMRGKRCEPAYVSYTAAAIAGVRGIEASAVREATAANARRVFFAPLAVS